VEDFMTIPNEAPEEIKRQFAEMYGPTPEYTSILREKVKSLELQIKEKDTEIIRLACVLNEFHLDVLGALAKAKIPTPEKGYLNDRAASVSSDIARLAQQRDVALLQVRAYDEEAQQFNDGYDAFMAGKPCNPPSYHPVDHDQWEVGWAWAKHCSETARRGGLESRVVEKRNEKNPPRGAHNHYCRDCRKVWGCEDELCREINIKRCTRCPEC
jgi:hypothetical protein